MSEELIAAYMNTPTTRADLLVLFAMLVIVMCLFAYAQEIIAGR